MPKKQSIISLSNLPTLIISVVLIVGIGAILGLLGYLASGIKENVTPIIQEPSIEIKDNYFGNEFIQVKLPQKNATIKNPVLVSGKANVFEGTVRIRIKDVEGNILADDFTTASGWMGKLYPFEKEINYTNPNSLSGTIEVFEESAKDGSEIYKVEIPVIFEDYVDMSDWQTYRNEKYGFEVKYPENWKNKGRKDEYFFNTMFKLENTELLIRTNLKGEVSPFTSPLFPICYEKNRFFVLFKKKLPKFIVSSIKEGIDGQECGNFLLSNEHFVRSEFCINEKLEVYLPETIKGWQEYFNKCGEDKDSEILYDFHLFCKGDKWQGREGLEKCNKLFDQILFTFKFIEK